MGRPDYTLDDVRADWANPAIDPLRDCFVAELDGGVAAYALCDHRGAFVAVPPDREGRGLGTALREAVEERQRERGLPLVQSVAPSNVAGVAHLRAAGYRPALAYCRMRGELDGLDPAPPAVPVRPFDLDREGPAVHALIEAAFTEIAGNVAEPFDAWLAEAARTPPGFRLAVEDDAGLAGVAIGDRWPDGVGFVRELAVDRRARGRGLGRELLRALFTAFRADGLRIAELSVQGENPALGLYTAAGMAVDARSERWVRDEAG